MLTFTTTSYADVQVPSGASYRISFPPNTVLMDSDTNIVTAMYLQFKNGDSYDLILLPADQSRMWIQNTIADFLGEVGVQLLGSQVRTGVALCDTLVDALLDHIKDEGVGILKRYLSQRRGYYYDVRTGEVCIVRALSQPDFDFGEGSAWYT